MDKQKSIAWIRTSMISALVGGIMAAIAAACDPSKYQIPRDVFSGKLIPYFLGGAGAMFGGALLRSPLGQSAMSAYKESQQQLEQDRADLEAAKASLKSAKEMKMTDKPTTPAPPPPTTPPAEPPQPPQK